MRTIYILILTFFCNGCLDSCPKLTEKYFRDSSYNFIVKKKYIEFREEVLEGISNEQSFETFRGVGYQNLYDSTSIGDIIIKDSGKTEMILIKKSGDTLIFPCYCSGKIYK